VVDPLEFWGGKEDTGFPGNKGGDRATSVINRYARLVVVKGSGLRSLGGGKGPTLKKRKKHQ